MIWLGLLLFFSGAALILLKPLLVGSASNNSHSGATATTTPLGTRLLRHKTALMVAGSALVISLTMLIAIRADLTSGSEESAAAPFLPPMTGTQQQLPDVDTMISRLADRLKSNPGDVRGWKMLGWSYLHLDRPSDAVDAYEKAIALEPSDAESHANVAEAMIRTQGGKVSAKAHKAILAALTAEPGNPRATFLLGRWHIQAGKPRETWKLWSDLSKSGLVPEDWKPELDRELAKLAPAVGERPPVSVTTSVATLPTFSTNASRSGPDAQTIAAAGEMSPEARARMIDGMVVGLAEKLKANPKDLDGWLMLARSRMVLGDKNAARTAISRAREEFVTDAAAQARITSHAREIGLTP
jgi:cytochrome c-type biogenesis protein CcmH